MITISSEYLDSNWEKIITEPPHRIILSEWDAGDAYVLSSLGQFPSSKEVNAAIIVDDKLISNVPIIIRLNKISKDSKADSYQLLMAIYMSLRLSMSLRQTTSS